MKGVDRYRVQILMGHKTPEMTQRYEHLSPDSLREAVERLSTDRHVMRGLNAPFYIGENDLRSF
jgi:hypothetical protein